MYSLYTRIKVIESGNGHLAYDNVKVKFAISTQTGKNVMEKDVREETGHAEVQLCRRLQ